MTERRLLLIGDMHIGSHASVMPTDVVTRSGNEIAPNPLQVHLLQYWYDMLDELKEMNGVDGIVNMSDTVDGMNFKQSGVPTWSPDVDLQCKVATDMISTIPVRRKLYYCPYGSLYHTGANLNSEDYIKSMLMNLGYECIVDKDISIRFGGCFFHARHETTVGKSVWMYRATHIARELMLASMSREKLTDGLDDDGTGHFCVLRGHTHQFINVNTPHTHGFVVPCWKARDDFIKKLTAESPTIGYIIIYCDEGECDWEVRCHSLTGDDLIKQHNADLRWK